MANPTRLLANIVRLQPNDSLMQVRVVRCFLTPLECQQTIDLAQKLGDPQTQAVAGLGCTSQSRIFPSAETEWIYAKLEQALKDLAAVYRFELNGFYQGAIVATINQGEGFDWHVDLGAGQDATRKLTVIVPLSNPADCDGGDVEFRHARSEPAGQGELTVFPSWLEYRLKPVTTSDRVWLLSWVSGPPFV